MGSRNEHRLESLRDLHEALAEADGSMRQGNAMTGNRHDYRITDKGIVYDDTLVERFMLWIHALIRKAMCRDERGAR